MMTQDNFEELIGREMYEVYRKTRKKTSKGANQYNLYAKAVKGILLLIQEELLKTPGGIYIEDFIYVSLIEDKRRMVKKGKWDWDEMVVKKCHIKHLDEKINKGLDKIKFDYQYTSKIEVGKDREELIDYLVKERKIKLKKI